MSFRARLTLAAAAAVAVAIVLAAPLVYVAVRGELRGQVDDTLRERAAELAHQYLPRGVDAEGNVVVEIPPLRFGQVQGYVQYVTAGGEVRRPASPLGPDDVALPPGPGQRVASGRDDLVLSDAAVGGAHLRVISVPTVQPGLAVQFALPLTDVDSALRWIRNLLVAVVLGGIAFATGLGLLVARSALAPVRRLTDATEHVTATGDLGARLAEGGRDELSRLAASFNRMMDALQTSQGAQRQLVADASHELRTPLTSLRTNIEVLARDRSMPPDERARLLDDVVEQLGEMTSLVAELVELARGEELPADEPEEVRLDLLVSEAVERTRRRAPDLRFEVESEEARVRGLPTQLERAVVNLLDNAAKWSPSDAVVEVGVTAGGDVTVRDHGPGISDDDLPHVFDRFYRAPSARGLPGSGLGLAIVKQAAERHGGSITAERATGGGTLMRLRLPPAS